MSLPLDFINFWYPRSLKTFLRVWHNLILLIEEDLAVSLMWRLIFAPLFHDSSIVGRVLSFIFRLVRVLIGLGGYFIATFFIFLIALFWFALPILFSTPLFNDLFLVVRIIFIFGVILFFYERSKPKRPPHISSIEKIWETTHLKPAQITIPNLLSMNEVKDYLFSLELSPDFFKNEQISLNDEVLWSALDLGKKYHALEFSPAYFFVSLVLHIPLIETKLLKVNLTPKDLEQALGFLQYQKNKKRVIFIWDEDFAITHLKGVNRGWLGAPTPALDLVSEDLTRLAAREKGPDFIGREKVISEIVNILSQETNQNVIIVGPAGAGKTSLVKFLAKKIMKGDAPASLATKRLVSLDISKLLSGVKTEGELAEKIKNVFEEVKFLGNIIIFVDEIQNLSLGDAGEELNLNALMLPHLESSEFQFIATTEAENYAKIIEKNSAFARVFTKVELSPATADETLKIIEEYAVSWEGSTKSKVTFAAIKEIIELASHYMHDHVLPDSAISLFTESKTLVKNGILNSSIIKEVFSRRVNVPIESLGNVQKEELLHLENKIHERLIDQEEAVKQVADTLRRAATALKDEKRPIGSFLFVGPTGVGKTELAKILAETYFKNRGAYIRFDMSEYQTADAVNRLIGSGDNPGELTEAIKNKPYSLILLDEFEKANKDILNLFLQVLEDGRLTDSSGRTVDFTNTIIIATSNAGSLTIAKALGQGRTLNQIQEEVKDELLEEFKPELVNRFDDVVIFKPLSREDLEKIVILKLNDLAAHLKEKGYLVEFDQSLVGELARRGFEPVLGARPLRRLIQDTLEASLSKMILEEKLSKGELLKVNVGYLSG